MPGTATIASQKVFDSELVEWLTRDSSDARELIVEAKLPARKVSFQKGPQGRMLPRSVGKTASRTDALGDLFVDAKALLGTPPTLLKAAGALAVKATRRETQKLLEHPLVRAVRLNRRLRRR